MSVVSTAVVTAGLMLVCGTACAGDEPDSDGSPATASTTTSPTTSPTTSVRDVCAGTLRCRTVDHADVDGDGRTDEVGWASRPARGMAIIRVRTDDDELLTKRLDVSLWFDNGAWGGAAPVDGRRGAELLIGTQMGAHTPGYTMLTYRLGRLVKAPSPSALGPRWYVDAAYSVDLGWWRHVDAGQVRLVEKEALRDGARRSFSGTHTTYAWRAGHWVKQRVVERHYDNPHQAARISGWHVNGLDRYPGL